MRRHRRRKLPEELITYTIEKLSHEGRGIAHHDGKVVFVAQALPGEEVNAQLTSRRDSYNEAKTVEVLTASTDRITPPCEYAEVCGGCSLQHFESGAQLAFKETVLHELLSHSLQNSTYNKLPSIGGPVLGYRRKARLGVRYVAKKSQVLIGFREKYSSFITNMSHCEVLDQSVSTMLPALSELISNLVTFRQIPQIEVAVGDKCNELPSIALVIRHLTPLPSKDIDLLVEYAEKNALAIYLQSGGVKTVKKLMPQGGSDRLFYTLPVYDLTMGFHPMDFTQVNAQVNLKMLDHALSLLQLEEQDVVLDLFCGLGNFTLSIARHCAQVIGVEGVQEMVERGEENARNNKVENAQFYCADLFKPVKSEAWLENTFSKVLLDPPRSGAIEMISTIVALKPKRIVYVSCNPATLARDAQAFAEKGYALSDAGVMDMFPQTTHMESIALFQPI